MWKVDKNGNITVEPSVLLVPIFNKIYKRNKNELKYIYFMCDYNSPYKNLSSITKHEKIVKDFMGINWKPDDLTNEAMQEYIKLNVTKTQQLVLAAEEGLDKLINYFKQFDPTDERYISSLEKVGKIRDSISILKKKVEEEKQNEKIRGGGKIGAFEDPDNE